MIGTRRMPADRRRQQILDATADLVAEAGFHGASIEAVARRAGISRPIVYEHFGDLAGVLEALIEQMSQRALVQLEAVLPAETLEAGPRVALKRALAGYLEVVRADPATWRLVLVPPEGAPPALREAIATGRAAVVARLARTLGPGIGTDLESPDPELTARLLTVIADESARLMLTMPEEFSPERILAHSDWLLSGLGPPRFPPAS